MEQSVRDYLAGEAAILIEPRTKRFSRDLGYFHDSEARVAEAFAADQQKLETGGYSIDVDLNQLGYIRAIVRKDGHATKVEWLAALDSVEPFVASRPQDEIGCLYYSRSRGAFVDPRVATDALPHFGRPGGVLPQIEEGSGS